jgi:hypothetical protein
MNDDVRRRREMFARVKQFQIENPPSIGSVAAAQQTVINTIVGDTDTSTAAQAEGFLDAGSAFDVKATRRENLRDICAQISRTARSMEYSFDGIAARYRMPPNLNDANLIATAHAFHTNSGTEEADFIAYSMPAGFRDTLADRIADLEASAADTGAAIDKHVAATATAKSQVRSGTVAVRILDGIYRNEFAEDPGTLAAWLSASHVEKAPQPAPPPVDPNP